MRLTSPTFTDGERIPRRHTGDGDDLSVPLEWSTPPEGTKELALIVDDPDAPRPEPWIHWLLYRIPSSCTALDEGVARSAILDTPAGAMQGRNSWTADNLGYRGPAPPPGHGEHRYRFTLYALDAEVDVEAGADVGALRAAMDGHVIASTTLTGLYER